MRNRFYVYIIRFYVYIISKVMLDHIKVYTSSELIENLKWPQERKQCDVSKVTFRVDLGR